MCMHCTMYIVNSILVWNESRVDLNLTIFMGSRAFKSRHQINEKQNHKKIVAVDCIMSSEQYFWGDCDLSNDLLNERTENIDLKFIQCFHILYTNLYNKLNAVYVLIASILARATISIWMSVHSYEHKQILWKSRIYCTCECENSQYIEKERDDFPQTRQNAVCLLVNHKSGGSIEPLPI